jgi:hypothetical protein
LSFVDFELAAATTLLLVRLVEDELDPARAARVVVECVDPLRLLRVAVVAVVVAGPGPEACLGCDGFAAVGSPDAVMTLGRETDGEVAVVVVVVVELVVFGLRIELGPPILEEGGDDFFTFSFGGFVLPSELAVWSVDLGREGALASLPVDSTGLSVEALTEVGDDVNSAAFSDVSETLDGGG